MDDPDKFSDSRPPTPTRLWLIPLALVLAAVVGVTIFFNSSYFDVECPGPGEAAAVACGEGTPGPREPVDPTLVQFADAVDLTAGPAPFGQDDEFVSITPDTWIPDLALDGWTSIDQEDLDGARRGFTSGEAAVHCYEAGDQTVVFNDFLAESDVFSAVAVVKRAALPEESAYALAADPVFGHYTADGLAVLTAEADFAWTQKVDPATGETIEGDWTEHWGFTAVYRGIMDAVICSYGGPEGTEAELEQLRERLLGIRLTPAASEPR